MIDYRTKWREAVPFDRWVAGVAQNAELWHGLARRARVSDAAVAAASRTGRRWKLLVLTEDWCGDAVNTVPYLARLAERAPDLELRVLGRDDHMDIMGAHRTPRPAHGTQPAGWSSAIPIVILLNEGFEECGWWGPRPVDLQQWFWTDGQAVADKAERYRHLRTWYARDRGATTLAEVTRLLAASSDGGARRVA